MKGMAILLSRKSPHHEESGEDGEYSEGESVADTEEFSEMFDAFTEALGVTPKDVEASRKRLSALFGIWCSQKGY